MTKKTQPKSEEPKKRGRKKAFTPEQEEAIIALYPTHTCADLAEKFGVTDKTIANFVKRHGIRKTPAIRSAIARANGANKEGNTDAFRQAFEESSLREQIESELREKIRAELLLELGGTPQQAVEYQQFSNRSQLRKRWQSLIGQAFVVCSLRGELTRVTHVLTDPVTSKQSEVTVYKVAPSDTHTTREDTVRLANNLFYERT